LAERPYDALGGLSRESDVHLIANWSAVKP
jgi:hypothetical protein